MSSMEYSKGKAIYLPKLNENETLEQQCERLCIKLAYTLETGYGDYYDSYTELVEDKLQEDYEILDNKLYEIKDIRSVDYEEDKFEAKRLSSPYSPNDFEFDLVYYSGACGFNEALGYAYKKLDKPLEKNSNEKTVPLSKVLKVKEDIEERINNHTNIINQLRKEIKKFDDEFAVVVYKTTLYQHESMKALFEHVLDLFKEQDL